MREVDTLQSLALTSKHGVILGISESNNEPEWKLQRKEDESERIYCAEGLIQSEGSSAQVLLVRTRKEMSKRDLRVSNENMLLDLICGEAIVSWKVA